MRILIVNKFLYPNGGSETYIFKIGEELRRQGHEVQYFGMEHEGRIVGNRVGVYTADMDFHGGGAARLLYPFRILYSREARKKLRLVLEDFRPDAVHLNNINFQLTPSVIDEVRAFDRRRKKAAASQGEEAPKPTRIVYTAHDYQWICPNHTLQIPSTGKLCELCTHGDFSNCVKNRCIHNSRMRSLLGTMEALLYKYKKTYAQVDKIICPSDFMNRMLSRNPVFAGKTVTMHNFIDFEDGGIDGKPQVSAKQDITVLEVSAEHNFAEWKATEITAMTVEAIHRPYILYFGRYSMEKGVRTLLGACRELPEVDFVFAGKGELQAEVAALPNVEDRGFLSGTALMETIRGAQLVVFPSEWYENCPFSVMEAQALGVPVLASDLGGTPELICRTQGQETGELFHGGDGDALAKKLLALWNDPQRCARYGRNARAWMKRFDTAERYVGKLLDMYVQ